MIRLRQLDVLGFRGAHELLSVDLTSNCTSIAIFGDNASGKSSLSDAIEWFYKGHVDHLWKEFCKESALRNVLLGEKESSLVTLSFNEASLNSAKTLSPGLKASQSNSSPAFESYIEQVESGQERLTLRNADLLSFILSSKTDKRQELARIIGYEALDDFRATIQRVITQLESNSDLVTARRNLPEYRKDILKLAGRSVTEETDLYVVAQEISTSVGVIAAISNDATYSGAIAAIKAQIGQQEKAARKWKSSYLRGEVQLRKVSLNREIALCACSRSIGTYLRSSSR
jgi:AAA domain-containing protein